MRAFSTLADIAAVERHDEHGGRGPISFRRMFDASEFRAPIDFVDVTTVPPGSTIGRHEHRDNEELYLIAGGTPLVRIDGEERRLEPGDISVVRPGQCHELENDTAQAVEIFVVQVRV
jgi:mannose-6-phosphate isomerase-like protein (cupin superfamily)